MTTMRTFYFLIFLMFAFNLNAQQTPRSAEVSRQTDGAEARGYSLLIEGTNKKAVEKAWKSFLQRESKRPAKDAPKPTYQVFTNEYVATNYLIPSITNGQINIIANIYESREGVRLTAWFQAEGKHFGPETNPELLGAAQAFVERFGHQQAMSVQSQTVKAEQRNLRSMRKELSKLQRQQQSLEKGISRTQSDRLRTEKELELHKAAQDTAVRQIARTQFTLNNLSPASADYQGVKAMLKEHEKALRSASSDVKKAQKSIVKADQRIRKNERKINELKLKQTDTEKRIKLQEDKLKDESNRLKNMQRQ